MKLNGVMSFIKIWFFSQQFPHCGIIKKTFSSNLTEEAGTKMLLKGCLLHSNMPINCCVWEHEQSVEKSCHHIIFSYIFIHCSLFFCFFAKNHWTAGLVASIPPGMGVSVQQPHLWELYRGCFLPSKLSYRNMKKNKINKILVLVTCCCGFSLNHWFFFPSHENT